MKSLAFLFGSRALVVARGAGPTRAVPQPELLPIASTPETAAAWRRWAEAGRASTDRASTARAITAQASTARTPRPSPSGAPQPAANREPI